MSDGGSIPPEGSEVDKKSLKPLLPATGDARRFLKELAKDAVCFANARGGAIYIGIEDNAARPPADQRVPEGAVEQIEKGIRGRTVNVQCAVERQATDDGDEYIVVHVQRASGIASTTDGRYFLRVHDECQPITGDDVARLLQDRPTTPWDLRTTENEAEQVDTATFRQAISPVRDQGKLSAHLAEKSDRELADFLGFVQDRKLTNLGTLFLGRPGDRRRLGAPVVDVIFYDEHGDKVRKRSWDDFVFSPAELVDELWKEIPDFREFYELPAGLFRSRIPAYDKDVVRELLVNALVHRSYEQGGEILVALHPDRMSVKSPGRLPLGVTAANILHESRRRNEALARVFEYLGLMEREGSGIDLVYDRMLASGRPLPHIEEGPDFVQVTVQRRVMHEAVLQLISEAEQRHHLRQRERIALGVLAQEDGLRADELAERLALGGAQEAREWLGRLPELGLVRSTGHGRGTRYYVPPADRVRSGLGVATNLKLIEPHRLRELVLEDLRRHPDSLFGEIHGRIGEEIQSQDVRKALKGLLEEGLAHKHGQTRGTRYRLGKEPD